MSAPGTDDEDRHAWERAGAFAVAPGVHRIPLPLPGDALRAVNTYAIDDGDGLVMIDAGWATGDSTERLERALAEIGHRLADIREFLVTHVHRDHYTHAIAVRRMTGARVDLGEGEKATIDAVRAGRLTVNEERMRRAGAVELADLVAQRVPPLDLAEWEYPDQWLADGNDIALANRTLRVIATPGHTVGHVVFQDVAAGAVFCGDHVLPHITPSIGVQPVHAESPLRAYLSSLRLMLTLPDSVVLPAHGPVTPSTHARVDELLQHHDRRLTATAEAVAAGASSGYEVAANLGWTRHNRRLADLDVFNRILAVNETVAHLDVLVERGWLTRSEVDGVVHFQRA